MAKIEKARYWVGVGYLNGMIDNWKEVIDDTLELPFAYCVHDKDYDEQATGRPVHMHLIIAFPNTTTYRNALNVFNLLSAKGKRAFNTVEAIRNIRSKYEYLIHNTKKAKEQGKYQYDVTERILGNNFDIGSYEQIDSSEKLKMFRELSKAIEENRIYNYMDFFTFVTDNYDSLAYMEIVRCHSSHFERLTKANYQKIQMGRLIPFDLNEENQQHEQHEQHEACDGNYCPECGSLNVKKHGKTQAGSQRMACCDCGKTFTI